MDNFFQLHVTIMFYIKELKTTSLYPLLKKEKKKLDMEIINKILKEKGIKN